MLRDLYSKLASRCSDRAVTQLGYCHRSSACVQESQGPQGSKHIRVVSAGYEDGNVAEFWVDGQKIEGTNDRGLNVVVLKPTTLTIEKKRSFDTYHSSDNSQSFADYINQIQDGMIVLVAVRDEAVNNLNDRGRSVFASIGGLRPVQGPSAYRCSYALIGIKGGSGLAEQDKSNGQGKVEVEAHIDVVLYMLVHPCTNCAYLCRVQAQKRFSVKNSTQCCGRRCLKSL